MADSSPDSDDQRYERSDQRNSGAPADRLSGVTQARGGGRVDHAINATPGRLQAAGGVELLPVPQLGSLRPPAGQDGGIQYSPAVQSPALSTGSFPTSTDGSRTRHSAGDRAARDQIAQNLLEELTEQRRRHDQQHVAYIQSAQEQVAQNIMMDLAERRLDTRGTVPVPENPPVEYVDEGTRLAIAASALSLNESLGISSTGDNYISALQRQREDLDNAIQIAERDRDLTERESAWNGNDQGNPAYPSRSPMQKSVGDPDKSGSVQSSSDVGSKDEDHSLRRSDKDVDEEYSRVPIAGEDPSDYEEDGTPKYDSDEYDPEVICFEDFQPTDSELLEVLMKGLKVSVGNRLIDAETTIPQLQAQMRGELMSDRAWAGDVRSVLINARGLEMVMMHPTGTHIKFSPTGRVGLVNANGQPVPGMVISKNTEKRMKCARVVLNGNTFGAIPPTTHDLASSPYVNRRARVVGSQPRSVQYHVQGPCSTAQCDWSSASWTDYRAEEAHRLDNQPPRTWETYAQHCTRNSHPQFTDAFLVATAEELELVHNPMNNLPLIGEDGAARLVLHYLRPTPDQDQGETSDAAAARAWITLPPATIALRIVKHQVKKRVRANNIKADREAVLRNFPNATFPSPFQATAAGNTQQQQLPRHAYGFNWDAPHEPQDLSIAQVIQHHEYQLPIGIPSHEREPVAPPTPAATGVADVTKLRRKKARDSIYEAEVRAATPMKPSATPARATGGQLNGSPALSSHRGPASCLIMNSAPAAPQGWSYVAGVPDAQGSVLWTAQPDPCLSSPVRRPPVVQQDNTGSHSQPPLQTRRALSAVPPQQPVQLAQPNGDVVVERGETATLPANLSKLVGELSKLDTFSGLQIDFKGWCRNLMRVAGANDLEATLDPSYRPGAAGFDARHNKLLYYLIQKAVEDSPEAHGHFKLAPQYDGNAAYYRLRENYVFSSQAEAALLLQTLNGFRLQNGELLTTFCTRLTELFEDLESLDGDHKMAFSPTQKLSYLLTAISTEPDLEAAHVYIQSEMNRGTMTYELALRDLRLRCETRRADDALRERAPRSQASRSRRRGFISQAQALQDECDAWSEDDEEGSSSTPASRKGLLSTNNKRWNRDKEEDKDSQQRGRPTNARHGTVCLVRDCTEMCDLPICRLHYASLVCGKTPTLALRENFGNVTFDKKAGKAIYPARVPAARLLRIKSSASGTPKA